MLPFLTSSDKSRETCGPRQSTILNNGRGGEKEENSRADSLCFDFTSSLQRDCRKRMTNNLCDNLMCQNKSPLLVNIFT